jgi:hypothetical protein
MERQAMSRLVLDEILGQCAPVGNKNMKWPATFYIHIRDDVLLFTRSEATDNSSQLLEMRADEDAGFEATRAYILALVGIQSLQGSIAAEQILLAQASSS